MTEVSFHFNVADRTGYACRLLRKATRQGARVVVTAPVETLSDLDRALWSFEAVEFIPHLLLPAGATVAPRYIETPVWLTPVPVEAPYHEVLVNLGEVPPAGFESFARVIELVCRDEPSRTSGRERWRHYAGRGYAIARHEVAE